MAIAQHEITTIERERVQTRDMLIFQINVGRKLMIDNAASGP